MTASSTPPDFPRHVVTAVIVTHNGARWLPAALSGLLGQDRPVQRVLAADTGSEDDSLRILAETFGEQGVVHLARRSGFGTAVDQAVRQTPPLRPEELPYQLTGRYDPDTGSWNPAGPDAWAAAEPERGDPDGTPYDPDDPLLALSSQRDDATAPRSVPLDPSRTVEWLWLLHDDCEPEPDALRNLLKVAENGDGYGGPTDSIAVIGPKLRGWYDRRQLLEVGVSVASSGRRWTGLERREQDQGQHDGVRPVLAVSSAGMLVRRDVWEALDGFDRAFPLMRDDADFGWRANAAGHQVLVAPDAVVRHAEAASRERRRIHSARGGPHQVDKAGAAFTLLANTPGASLPWIALRLLLGSVLRALGYLVAKVPGQAVDEILGLSAVLLRPYRVVAARRRRARQRRVSAKQLRPLFPKAGATALFTVEQLIGDVARRAEPATTSARHSAVETGPVSDDADFLDEGEKFPRLKRLVRRPGPLLLVGLVLLALIAFRGLLGGGALQGGGLLPAPDGASGLWSRLTEFWHPLGTGSAGSTPPWLAVPAAAGSLLFGNAGLAVTLMMLLSVPLAGFFGYLAARPLVPNQLVRIWLGAGYALAPAVTAGIAGGRLGMAVLAVLLPLIARSAVSAVGWTALGFRGNGADPAARHTGSWRSAWLCGLLLAVATAFTPVVWPITLVLLAAALAWLTVGARRGAGRAGPGGTTGTRRALPLRALAILAVPMVLLAPWSLRLLTSPSRFLAQAGLPDLTAAHHDLLGPLLSPGGSGVLPGLVYVGVLLAALAALLRADRLRTVLACWAVAAVGAVFGLWAMHSTAGGGTAWNGAVVLVCTAALLAAAGIGADGARERVAGSAFGWKQPAALVLAVLAGLGPAVTLVWWGVHGAGKPLTTRQAEQVPPFVAEESSTTDQARTLVLRTGRDGGRAVDYSLVRGSGVRLGDGEVLASTGGNSRLDEAVRNLAAGTGGDQPRQLATFAVRYIVARPPVDKDFARVLDSTAGLTRLSQEDGTALWRNERTAARLTLEQPGKPATAVRSGRIDAAATLPSGPSGRVLRLADHADPNWSATLDGKPLSRVTLDGWAQGFRVPESGGALRVGYDTPIGHVLWLWLQALLVLVAVVLALPGRGALQDDEPEVEVEPAAPPGAPGGRRARRLAAQAEAAAANGGAPAVPGAGNAPGASGEAVDPAVPDAAAMAGPAGQEGWFGQDPYSYTPEGYDPATGTVPDGGAPYAGSPAGAAAPDAAGYADPAAHSGPPYPDAGAAPPPDPSAAQAGGYGYPQPGTAPAGYDPAAHGPEAHQQGGYDPNGYSQDTYGQDSYGQGGYGYPQPGHGADGYPSGTYDPGTYAPVGYEQTGYGYPQPGHGADGYPPGAYDPNPYPPAGHAPNGYDPNGYGAGGYGPDGYGPAGPPYTGGADPSDPTAFPSPRHPAPGDDPHPTGDAPHQPWSDR